MRLTGCPALRPGALILALMLAIRIEAQEPLPEDRGVAGLWQELKRLRTTISVLHIVAHPDDEDAALLAYLSRGFGCRTMLLSLTRGEGGANLISSDFFDALGVLRTLELAEADRRYGVEQFYTRAADYGYSKTLAEALRSWGGEERVLEDVVRVVRRERPDIIFSRFRGDPRDGHGHHQFAGVMAQRAFDAAADPARFPDQLREGLRPWQARKLYLPASSSEPATAETIAIAVGAYDPVLGLSYAQIGQRGYALHRSQGMMGAPSFGGPRESRYRLVSSSRLTASEVPQAFARGVPGNLTDQELPPGAGELGAVLGAMSRAINAAMARFGDGALQPSRAVEELVLVLREARRARELIAAQAAESGGRAEIAIVLSHLDGLLERKQRQVESALALAAGIELVAVTGTGRGRSREPGPDPAPPFADAVPGDRFPVRVRFLNRGPWVIEPQSVELVLPPGWKSAPGPLELKALGENELVAASFSVEVAADAELTRPYWHRPAIDAGFYTLERPEYATLPFAPPQVRARVAFKLKDELVTAESPLLNAVEDAELGARHLPLSVVPALSVQFSTENGIVRERQRDYAADVLVRSAAKTAMEGDLRLELPAGWHAEPASFKLRFEKEGQEAAFRFRLSLPAELEAPAYTIEAVAAAAGREHREGWRTITGRDLGRHHFFRPARHTLRAVDAGVAPDLEVGYVMGTGDEVPHGLGLLGVKVALLSRQQIETADLQPFSALWIGVRAYAVRPELKTHHQRLMDYVERGGVLVVQYQTPEYQGNFAPFPYDLTSSPEEVSEQDSAVEILEPTHPLLTAPNVITPRDFDGWIEQRGSKFWKSWDSRFTPLLETHDTGQEPQRGGYLFARHGRGAFVYCAYAWYRQLPAGVPGAYRLVANLASLPATMR